MENSPSIRLIGAGTGSSNLLRVLKDCTSDLSAIVNMSDDGGSSGILRDQLGVMPPGDVRQCLVALSEDHAASEGFNYRYGPETQLSGHPTGNLILANMEIQYGSFEKAVEVASSMLKITGQVIPVTLQPHVLQMQDGEELIEGEYVIGNRPITNKDSMVRLEPNVPINPKATESICEADMLIIAPGNLYGSILPTLAVDGMREAISNSSSIKVVVSNLVTMPGQTDGWHAADYVKEIERYIGKNQVDYVLYNQLHPSAELLQTHARKGELPVRTDPEEFSKIAATPIGANLVSDDIGMQDEHDTLINRTLIKHDARQVGKHLMSLLK